MDRYRGALMLTLLIVIGLLIGGSVGYAFAGISVAVLSVLGIGWLTG